MEAQQATRRYGSEEGARGYGILQGRCWLVGEKWGSSSLDTQ
jgi:hypothetical protein